jgi:hypothetical protein
MKIDTYSVHLIPQTAHEKRGLKIRDVNSVRQHFLNDTAGVQKLVLCKHLNLNVCIACPALRRQQFKLLQMTGQPSFTKTAKSTSLS